MKKLHLCFFCLSLLVINITACGQTHNNEHLYVAFYNIENLFDTENHPDKNDEEWTPAGEREWTEERLEKKMYDLSRVIRSMNNENGPDILGVCEVEHEHLLQSMIAKFLSDKNYKTAYKESPDNRGIDNGLIYDADKFTLLSVRGDTVYLPDRYPTRLILYAELLTRTKDTLHVFVNHWPSRRGGEELTEPNRVAAAIVLRKAVDSLFDLNPFSKIIILGDFNDEPGNNSVLNTLGAHPVICDSITAGKTIETNSQLFNLAFESYLKGEGTFKYQDQWNMLDHIIVSGELLVGERIRYQCSSFEVYKPEFIVTQTGSFAGTPFPTYGGRRYLGGYSDHFPVIAKFLINISEEN